MMVYDYYYMASLFLNHPAMVDTETSNRLATDFLDSPLSILMIDSNLSFMEIYVDFLLTDKNVY